MKYLLGIDFGGGASKATLLNENGVIVAEHTVEYPTLHPTQGACEQDPNDWIAALCSCCEAILQHVRAQDIVGIALDSATHTFVVCDETVTPLRHAVHWTDTRSRAQATRLFETHGDVIFEKTYHKPDTIWTLPQLIWLRETEPETFAKIQYVFFEKDYIRFKLTDVYCTDHIEAQGSMLYDCNTHTWDNTLCELAGLSADILPPLKTPTDVIGTVTAHAAKMTGLAKGTPVICGTTDTCMEVFASGAVACEDATVKLATAGRICVITDRPHPDRHLVNYSHIESGLWYPGTATKSAASAYRFYRDVFGGDYAELDKAAADIPVGCDGLRFHPYLNGELTPYADPSLCGSFTGMRATHTRAHFTRAVLEGVALSLLDSKRYLDGLHIPYKPIATLIGGGSKGTLWSQITADVLGMTLRITESSDSSLGSAMLAGIAVGVFENAADAVSRTVKVKRTVTPCAENTAKYAEIFDEYKRITDALAPIYQNR